MANFTVRNSLNPHKAVQFGVTYRQLIDKTSDDGELIWVLEVATDEPHVTTSGTIAPYYINLVDTADVDMELEKAVAALSAQINWAPLVEDTRAPLVDSISPDSYISSIHENVIVDIQDLHPSAGIDIDNVRMFINDVEVTGDLIVSGDEYDYELKWKPPRRIYEQES